MAHWSDVPGPHPFMVAVVRALWFAAVEARFTGNGAFGERRTDLALRVGKALGLPEGRVVETMWPAGWSALFTKTLGELRLFGCIETTDPTSRAIRVLPAFMERMGEAFAEADEDAEKAFAKFATKAIDVGRPVLPPVRERILTYAREHPEASYEEIAREAGNSRKDAWKVLRELVAEGLIPKQGLLSMAGSQP